MSDPVGTEKPEAATDETAAEKEEAQVTEADEVRDEEAGGEEAKPLSKAERRELLRVQAQKAHARKAGRQALGFALAGLAVVAVIVGVVYAVDSRSGSAETAQPSAAPSAPLDQPTAQEPAVPFPPVPAGADPALNTTPVVEKGTEELKAGEPKITYLIRGTGPATENGQQITANYVGALYKTAEEFDSSWSRSEAITFVLGAGQLIEGWEKGLLGVPVGSRIALDLPPDLAYGDKDDGSGRPVGPLRFVVDVLAAEKQ